MNDDKGVYRSYQKAGSDFLAVRLVRLFTKIKTEEDRVLHNDMLNDVLAIIRGEEETFFRSMAENMFYRKVDRKGRLLTRLAKLILALGQKKG